MTAFWMWQKFVSVCHWGFEKTVFRKLQHQYLYDFPHAAKSVEISQKSCFVQVPVPKGEKYFLSFFPPVFQRKIPSLKGCHFGRSLNLLSNSTPNIEWKKRAMEDGRFT